MKTGRKRQTGEERGKRRKKQENEGRIPEKRKWLDVAGGAGKLLLVVAIFGSGGGCRRNVPVIVVMLRKLLLVVVIFGSGGGFSSNVANA